MPDLSALIKHDFDRLASKTSALAKGYVFVPMGDVYVTRHCRDRTAVSGKLLYIVYDPKTRKRIGLRCPREVYELVSSAAETSAERRQRAVEAKHRRDIDVARQTLLQLFPRIPLGNAQQVLDHGFLKGSGRVGRATTLNDDEKCTLAVVAHARHVMTPYDNLLKELEPAYGRADGREKARATIKDTLAAVLKEWRLPIVKPDRVVAQKEASTFVRNQPVLGRHQHARGNTKTIPKYEKKNERTTRYKNENRIAKKATKKGNGHQDKKHHAKIWSENLMREPRSPERRAAMLAQVRIQRSSRQDSIDSHMSVD